MEYHCPTFMRHFFLIYSFHKADMDVTPILTNEEVVVIRPSFHRKKLVTTAIKTIVEFIWQPSSLAFREAVLKFDVHTVYNTSIPALLYLHNKQASLGITYVLSFITRTSPLMLKFYDALGTTFLMRKYFKTKDIFAGKYPHMLPVVEMPKAKQLDNGWEELDLFQDSENLLRRS